MSDVFEKLKENKSKAEKSKDNNVDGNVNDNVRGNGDGSVDSNVESEGDSNANNGITIPSKEEKNKSLKRTFYIDKEYDDFLNLAARKTNRNKSEIVEIAIDYLKDNVTFK